MPARRRGPCAGGPVRTVLQGTRGHHSRACRGDGGDCCTSWNLSRAAIQRRWVGGGSGAMTNFPVESEPRASEVVSPTRPLYWSMRRELWENRSLYIAPLVVAAVVMFGFVISTIGMPHRRRAVLMLDAAKQRAAIGEPYDIAA